MSYLDFYKENRGNGDVMDVAKRKLVTVLLSENKVGQNKIEDIGDTDMESKITVQFMPTLVYTFQYNASNDIFNGIEFKDSIPVVMVCKKDAKSVSGLNLNLIPMETRAVMLDVIDKSLHGYYSGRGLEDARDGKMAINEQFARMLMDDKQRMVFLDYLESQLRVNIKRSYRTYKLEHIKKPRMIEYSEYQYIPLLAFDDSVRGVSLSKLQTEMARP